MPHKRSSSGPVFLEMVNALLSEERHQLSDDEKDLVKMIIKTYGLDPYQTAVTIKKMRGWGK